MKKFHLLILGLATLCIISCGNKKDPLEKALELATEASELSESIDDVVESEESSALESVEAEAAEETEVADETSADNDKGSDNPEIDQTISELEDKADEILKKCDKIGKGVGILDIQPDQNELLDKISELKENPDLSSAQKKRLDKLTLKTSKIATKLAGSTLNAIFGN